MMNDTQENSEERDVKYPWLAVLLSNMFPGAGQIYAGAKTRGVFFIAFTIVLLLIIAFAFCGFLFTKDAIASRTFAVIASTAFISMLVLGIYNLFDAYRIAKRHNAGHVQTDADAGHHKSWLAAFLSAFFPGMGQFYNRQVIKGIAFIVLMVIAWVLKAVFAPLFIFAVLVYLLVIKHAFDSAEVLNGFNDRFFSQKRAVVLFIVIMIGMQEAPFAVLIKNNIIEAFKIPSGTMYPTLKIGDHFLISKTRWLGSSLKRGDVIVFPYPVNPRGYQADRGQGYRKVSASLTTY
jgi:TM2 domain-containing membrane protein YozV